MPVNIFPKNPEGANLKASTAKAISISSFGKYLGEIFRYFKFCSTSFP